MLLIRKWFEEKIYISFFFWKQSISFLISLLKEEEEKKRYGLMAWPDGGFADFGFFFCGRFTVSKKNLYLFNYFYDIT